MNQSNDNLLIEASAGTGKTQALAERLIELIRRGVKPHEIVALTFSRAAAGEIFERFVTLLAESAGRSPQDAELLRTVIATQHLSQIGTLDSFLMRIVRSFPLELGMSGELEIMDDYRASVERGRTSFAILRKTDEQTKRVFVDAFSLAMNRENVRSFVNAYREFIKAWHEMALAMPDSDAWGVRPEVPLADVGDISDAADRLVGLRKGAAWEDFVVWLRSFRGSFTGIKGIAKKLLEVENLFHGATIEFQFNRGTYVFGGDELKAVRAAMAAVMGYVMRMKTETARGVYRLISAYERVYDKRVRSCGKLVFADVPRLIGNLGENERLALEYRMDARIRAWALDEFQDTSREQWEALSGLVGEARDSAGEKSVFIVGDRKQAIYGWRHGDVGIFERERDSGAYTLWKRDINYRSSPAVIEAVNRVFVGGVIEQEFPVWKALTHEAAKTAIVGFVQKVESPGRSKSDFIVPVYNALKAVDPIGRGLSAAVLVRSNDFGEEMTAGLRAMGLDGVVWEGESGLLDTPAIEPFLDLARIADHPGDKQSYRHFIATPLAAAMYPDGVPDESELSVALSREFTTKGMVRTFKEVRALLPEAPNLAWSDFTESRFVDMLRSAAKFELAMDSGTRLSDFIGFLGSNRRREMAGPGKIRVMTIHHSKGLGFDYVVLPLYEPDGLTVEPKGPLVGEDWVLPDPGCRISRSIPALVEAWDRRKTRAEQEELCAYYVAMTRARLAMTVILHPEPKKSGTLRFSTIVRASLPNEIGDNRWYRLTDGSASGGGNAGSSIAPPATVPPRGQRKHVKRLLPSVSFKSGSSAGELFAPASARKCALERGREAHAEYEGIEWIEDTSAKNDFERALVRPEGFTALWRERPFEVFADGEWISGRFDRVVFADGKAEIIDFKTNARLHGETPQDFERRMVLEYRGQMQAYRRAVVALTGIAPERVTAKLLLAATASAVAV